tara:strand:- start:3081 stop:4394 length:1314 start_codon:yes stop_codon:yes gene_type:complete
MSLVSAQGNNRRAKAALFLVFCTCAGAIPHWIEPPINLLPAISLAFLLGGYGLSVVLRDRDKSFANTYIQSSEFPEDNNLPSIDVLIAARDEENVVNTLINKLTSIKYPEEKISFWIIDDGSEDQTSYLVEKLIKELPNFNLLKRLRNEGGGKSGALNYALNYINNDWLLVLDADAQLQEDVLLRIILFAKNNNFSAVQLRKAVINSQMNRLTCFQSMEMAMDASIQRGRLQSGGVVELRGNGQLINRKVLDKCGGFNEETVTDDLDLSLRLLISGAHIGILWDPPVQEEAVETWSNLIKQRQRWAEGGLQRFFDYFTQLNSSNINLVKRRDLVCFFLLQYAIPLVSFSDLLISFITQTLPTYWPLSFVALSVSGLAYWKGCSRNSEGPEIPKPKPIRIVLAMFYLLHWFVVIPVVTLKMSLLPKKLIWAKTIHKGD